jgi:hypothetical protein
LADPTADELVDNLVGQLVGSKVGTKVLKLAALLVDSMVGLKVAN